jgi:ABC transport system ATP-binding/permease protein
VVDNPQTDTHGRPPVASFDSTGTIRIGRDADNDIVLADLWISKKHAEIRVRGEGHEIVDLGSANGLHHNGRRVPRAVLNAGDVFTIGRHEFLFDGTHLYQHDDTGPTSVIADEITVQIEKAILLHDVSFALRHGTLLGIIGPSGCGKSTLLRSMTGFRAPSQGGFMYDNKDLYRHYSELRYRIGMVPQDDVLHRQLTVRRALRFAAALRFSPDVPRKERTERVDEVLDLLGLTERAGARISTLSGGQVKRTSVALELLTEPSLLALDEPTSGLDPALDREVMRELRLLADRGRTVVVVTHSVLHLELCDYVLVMCLGGRMGFFGPPDELLAFFGSDNFADVFDKITNDAHRWAQRYRNSEVYRKYVGEVVLELATNSDEPALPPPAPTPRVEAVPTPTPRPAPAAATPTASLTATVAAPPLDAWPGGAGPAAAAPPINVGLPVNASPVPAAPAKTAPAQASAAPAPAPVKAAPATAVPAKAAPAAQKVKLRGRAALGLKPKAPKKPAAETPHFADSKPVKPTKSGVQELSVTRQALHPVAQFRQFFTLCLRMVMVIFSDLGYSAFLIGLPMALAALSHTIPGGKGLGKDVLGWALEANRILIVLVTGAAFMGLAIAIREIVSEGSIYRRERAIGLSPGAYLASKVVVFLLIDIIQVTLFVNLSLWNKPKPPEGVLLRTHPTVELIIGLTLVAVTSTVLGLLASALVRTAEQTTPILVVVVMAQLVLSGGLFPIDPKEAPAALNVLSWIDPSRWGYAAVASTTNLVGYPKPDPLWDHVAGDWWRATLLMVLQIVVLLVCTRLALRRFEPGKN